jgi:hypothetical protein
MNWRWSDHLLLQLKERDLSKEVIDDALKNPDSKVPGSGERIIYHKLISGKLLRIVTEGDLLITAYITNKVSKYNQEVK